MYDQPHTQPLRIASYNIRKAKGLDRRRDPGRILDVINGLNADVVALQEADLRLGDRPAALCRDAIAAHTDFEVVPVARNDVSLGWHGNAVLVRKGTPVRRIEHLDLPGIEPRGAVRVDLAGVSLVAAHLGLARPSRRKQLHRIVARLADAQEALIIGDFNEWSCTRGLEPLQHRFDVYAPGRSFHAARPLAALDRIAMTAGIELRGAGVVETALSRRASDHLPIWAEVTIAR